MYFKHTKGGGTSAQKTSWCEITPLCSKTQFCYDGNSNHPTFQVFLHLLLHSVETAILTPRENCCYSNKVLNAQDSICVFEN